MHALIKTDRQLLMVIELINYACMPMLLINIIIGGASINCFSKIEIDRI